MYATWIDWNNVTSIGTVIDSIRYAIPNMEGEVHWTYLNSPKNKRGYAQVQHAAGNLDVASGNRRGGAHPALYQEGTPL